MSVGVVIFRLVIRVAPGHGVRREGGEVTPAVVRAVAVVWVVTVVRVMGGHRRFPLDLGGSSGQEIDIEVVAVVGRAAHGTPEGVQVRGRSGRV
jgi:hypothetical protein